MTPLELARVARAMTLRERCDLARAHPDWFHGEPRLALWARAITDGEPEDNATFAKRLAWFGVDFDEALLASRELSLPSDFAIPDWVTFTRDVEAASSPSATSDGRVVFEPILAPWVAAAERLVGARWDALAPDARDGLRRELFAHLASFAQPSFTHLLERERLGRQSGNDLFLGALESAAPSTEIYDAFIVRALEERAWFDSYPCLVRLLATRARLWAESCVELLENLESDRTELEARFGTLGALVRIDGGLSDPHHGGRRVRILAFEHRLLVHKPRAVAIERVFSELLQASSDRLGLELHALRFLDRGDYGWVEHVAPAALARGEEGRYFERAGALLALFWALGGTDGHEENLIAYGAHPVLVDVETLLGPPLHAIAYENELSSSVSRTGLLPTWTPLLEQVIDQSGLGGRRSERRGARFGWVNRASDHMRVESVPVTEATRGPSEPHFEDGRTVAPDADVPALVRGFTAAYDILPSLVPKLDAFEGLASRVVVRATLLYQRIQQESLVPARMADGFLRSVWLDRLVRPMLGDAVSPGTWLEEERAALESGDVPRFAIGVGERTTTSGIAVEVSGLDHVQQRLARLSPTQSRFQQRVIELSFLARELALEGEPATIVDARPKSDLKASVTTLIEPARELARTILESAHDLDGSIEWLHLDFSDEKRPTPRFADASLYSGTVGIGLALAAASTRGSTLGEALAAACRRTALGTYRALSAAIDASSEAIVAEAPLGGFIGVGGLIYGLATSSKLLDEPRLMESAKRLALGLSRERIAEDCKVDLLDGNAGLIMALASVSLEESALVERVGAAADAILRSAVAEPGGLGWRSLGASRARSGISHGNAGIALALFEAHRVTRRSEFREAALRAIALERALEVEGSPETRAPGWCNGPTGIALARARMLLIEDLPELRDDLVHAIAQTQEVNVPLGSLCCGMAGVHDTLSFIGDALGDAALVAESHRELAARWTEGAPPFHPRLDAVHSARALGCMPSLMRGAGGILLGLVRALPGERLPYPLGLL